MPCRLEQQMESCIDKYSIAPCCLCGSSEHNATYFCALNAVEKSFIERHHGPFPDERARICKKHQLEAKHYHEDHHYVPKWKRNKIKKKSSNVCSLTVHLLQKKPKLVLLHLHH